MLIEKGQIKFQIIPRYSSLLHNIGCCNIITPYIILPLLQAYNSTQHIACVNSWKKEILEMVWFFQLTYPHVNLDSSKLPDGSNGCDHWQTHPDNIDGMIGSGDRESRDTVVAVSKDLDPEALIITG